MPAQDVSQSIDRCQLGFLRRGLETESIADPRFIPVRLWRDRKDKVIRNAGETPALPGNGEKESNNWGG